MIGQFRFVQHQLTPECPIENPLHRWIPAYAELIQRAAADKGSGIGDVADGGKQVGFNRPVLLRQGYPIVVAAKHTHLCATGGNARAAFHQLQLFFQPLRQGDIVGIH